MNLTNIEIVAKPQQLFDESNNMIRLVGRMRMHMSEAENIMRATAEHWTGEAGDLQREIFFGRKETIENAMTHMELRATDLARIAATYLETDQVNAAVSDDLPSDVIV